MMSRIFKTGFILTAVVLCTSAGAAVMRPLLDSSGSETGSYNVNPDPDGEPWIVTPLVVTPEVQQHLDAIPEWEPRKKLSKTTATPLPHAVNHVEEPEFRPIFNQKGGSCSAASGTGYVYTWEANILTGASGQSDRCMYMYGYNFLNKGNIETGIWWYDAWNIMKYTGCVREAGWPSALGKETGVEWANTYEAYHNANFDRCSTYFKISKPGKLENLPKVKQWLFDHGRGDPKGGCVQLNAGVDFKEKTIPAGSAEAGSKIATVYDGPNTIHAMVLAGYNDDVYLEADKKGAFLLVNSYGRSFGTNGTIWIPYDKFITETEVYLLEVVKHLPRLEFKVALQNYGKTDGRFTAGFAPAAVASAPADTQGYGKAFSGNTGSFTGEIGLDCTKFWSAFSKNGGNGTFFLKSKGAGTIAALSLMMYDETGKTLVREIRCPQSNISLGTTMSISVDGKVGVPGPTFAVRAPEVIALRQLLSSGYALFIPFGNASNVAIKDLRGRVLARFAGGGSLWYSLPSDIRPGIKIVTFENNGKLHAARVNVVR